jgi:hypothetical protein
MPIIATEHEDPVIACAHMLNSVLEGKGFALIVFDDDPEGVISYESNRPLKKAMPELCNILRTYAEGGLQDNVHSGSNDIPD